MLFIIFIISFEYGLCWYPICCLRVENSVKYDAQLKETFGPSYGRHLRSMIDGQKHFTALTTWEGEITSRLSEPAVEAAVNIDRSLARAPYGTDPFV
jgi:hypothetical protein